MYVLLGCVYELKRIYLLFDQLNVNKQTSALLEAEKTGFTQRGDYQIIRAGKKDIYNSKD